MRPEPLYSAMMEESGTLAVVEDDAEIRALLGSFLESQGFRVLCVEGAEKLDMLLTSGPKVDLVVLDWMLPGEDGLSICRRLRAASEAPIIMLTAKDEDTDRVLGLEAGADDYVSKPFNPRVLLARIRAVLRRTRPPPGLGHATERLKVADIVVDVVGRRVVTGQEEREVALTGAEFDILLCFVERPQRVLSRDQLLDWTRGRMGDVFDRTIDVQVSRLRRKLDDGGSSAASLIKTVRNAGYILAAPVSPA